MILKNNFNTDNPDEYRKREEVSRNVLRFDHKREQHLLPQFFSKVASVYAQKLLPEDNEDSFIDRLKTRDYHYKNAKLQRGIRTLKEIAHFVRCIPVHVFEQEMTLP
jgi:hypothetical protein